MSEPPETEELFPEGYETPLLPTPDPPEIRAERFKAAAVNAHDKLIQQGGRPTRLIRFVPRCKAVLGIDGLCYEDAEKVEVLFHPGPGSSGPGRHPTELEFTVGHWAAEYEQFSEELRRWQASCHDQQQRREKSKSIDTDRQPDSQDPRLAASLKRLREWKEYRDYFQRAVGRYKRRIEGLRKAMEMLERKGPEVEDSTYKRPDFPEWEYSTYKGHRFNSWMGDMEMNLEHLAREEKRFEWVKQEFTQVLSDCAASLMGAPILRRRIEESSKLEATQVFNTLLATGGKPTRSMRPVPRRLDVGMQVRYIHLLCHWEAEYSQFKGELQEWNRFPDCRQRKPENPTTEALQDEQGCYNTTVHVALWKDYQAYQQLEVDNRKGWVEFWQRRWNFYDYLANHWAGTSTAKRYVSHAEKARSWIEEAQQQFHLAEMRLEWVEEQCSTLVARDIVSVTAASLSNISDNQVKPAKRSGKAALQNVAMNGSAPRNYHDKRGSLAPARSKLSPIHCSKISKIKGRRSSLSHRIFRPPTRYNLNPPQGRSATMSLLLPCAVSSRKSSRLSDGSGVIPENISAHPPPIKLRRSNRISKLNDAIITPASHSAMNPATVPQATSSQRFRRSNSNRRLVGKSPDSSSAKPRGITKRQMNNVSRSKTKVPLENP